MKPFEVVVRNTKNYSEKEINNWLERMPPIVSIQTAGDFIVVGYESIRTESGQWKRFYENNIQRRTSTPTNTLKRGC